MALSEATVNKHNIKRAEVFAANGLCDLDIAFAHPEFTGYATSDTDCGLCGHKHIKWLFAIRFDAPDITTALGKITTGIVRTEAVAIKPVGSKCITDWLQAVPESMEKLEALKRWDKELAKANRAKAKKALENKLVALGYPTLADLADACLVAYHDLKKASVGSWLLRNTLRKYGKKAKYNRIKSAGTVKKAHDYVVEASALLPAKPTEADPLAHCDDDTRKAILKGRDVWKTGAKHLTAIDRLAFVNIGKSLVKYGSFYSDTQRESYAVLIGIMEDGTAPVATTAPVKAIPGDDNYVSASGLVGARY